MRKRQGFKPVRSKRTFDLVLRQLRGMIEGGQLKPGEKLPSEPNLASELGVSRTALRETLKVLELSGYIEIRKGYGGGTFIARPTAEEFRMVSSSNMALPAMTPRQLNQVRFAIEPQAARIAAQADDRDVEPLEVAVREMEVFDDRPARVLEVNVGFHIAVAKASGNPVFVAIIEDLRPVIYRQLNLLVRNSEWREKCRQDHVQIIMAILDGDYEEAEGAMQRHLAHEIEAESSEQGRSLGGDESAEK